MAAAAPFPPAEGTRETRGLALARDKRIKPVAGAKWYVPSATQPSGGYIVDVETQSCTCPDHETTGGKCKHAYAVEFTMRSTTTNADGSVTTREATVRVTYGQNWHAYNLAQTHEREHVSTLLGALCEGIVQPPQVGRGRPRLPLADLVYAATMKVYTGFSARRSGSDVRDCENKGFIKDAMHFNSVLNLIKRPDITPLLTALVEESAVPLRALESTFAADSTGFGTSTYHRWHDEKYGRENREPKKKHDWLKLHAMCGVKTHAITSVLVTDTGLGSGDSPRLPGLIAATHAKGWTMNEVAADMGYLSNENFEAIEAVGALPLIPFKVNNKGNGPAAWRRAWGLFTYRREDFLKLYHQRSNVEAVFSSLKRKFGSSVKSIAFEAQVNEVLLKCLCHNLSCVTHAMYEFGVEPTFQSVGAPPEVLQ
jgi:hypothetical protein